MKKQIKKSISLFLAVLMVLSCWVWVAPQKASADNTTGQYYVKYVVGTIREAGNNGNWEGNTMTINWTKTDGTTGSTGAMALTKSKYTSQGATNVVVWEGYIDGFPTSVGWYMKMKWKAAASVYLSVGDCKLYVGKDASSCTTVVTNTDSFKWQNDAIGQGTNEATFTLSKLSGVDPYIAKADAMADTSVECPAWGTTTTNKTTAAIPTTYWDQYGVKWLGSVDPSYHVSTTKDGDPIGGTEASGVWASEDSNHKGYVNINAKAQEETIVPGAEGKKDIYMVATVKNSNGDEIAASQKITVSYNKVAFTFNADGSISGLNSTINDSSGVKLGTGTYTFAGYFGQSDKFPTNTSVTAGEGYTFKGFWTGEQPKTGDASYDAFEADYAEPCSSEDYEAYKEMPGATQEDHVVMVDSNGDGITERYYNAGEAWDTNITTFDGNRTYYGWWLRDDISVKFYDVDGSYFGEQTVKYGQTYNDIEWPESKYLDTGYTSGAFTYTVDGTKWVDNYTGETITAADIKFTKDLLLTPLLTNGNFQKDYQITFVDQDPDINDKITNIGEIDGTTYTKRYGYRTTVTPPATREVPDDVSTDLQYSYTFEGWSTVNPINGRYHVLLEDADFDVNGTAIGINRDWIVRSEATYYAVYRRHTRTYAVNFWYNDATATQVSRRVTVKYGDKLTPPTDYVPYRYAIGGYGYTFANWSYTSSEKGEDGKNLTKTFGYADSIIFTSDYINITLGAVDGPDAKPISIQAAYGDAVPTPYTVTFKYRNDAGVEVIKEAEVEHGKFITSETVTDLAPATEYDNGEALVEFLGTWNVVEGVAKQTVYETDELTSFSPTSHITFEAKYGNPRNFYTVTYIDGANTYSERVLVGSNLPTWTYKSSDDSEEDIVYIPSMADDEKGSYEFQGWFDEKQTDATYNATNGTKYTTADKVSGNLTLYPQFKYTPFKYTIKFMGYDADGNPDYQLAIGEFEYGQDFSAIFTEAQRSAQLRPSDETYNYTFIGWDQPYNEDNLVCEGKDITFTALYKASYRYYDAKWYNSESEMTGEPLTTTHHTYNSKVYAPSVTLTPPADNTDGTKNVFEGWYYKDTEGKEVKFTRGMLITSEMSFYAKYTKAAMTFTVTTVVDGNTTAYTVASGDKVTVPDPAAGWVDADKHNAFDGWYTTETCECTDTDSDDVIDCTCVKVDFDNTTITTDTTVYARFEESDHVYDNMLDIEAPTYYKEGTRKVWCSCDPDQAYKTEEIAMLTDKVAPTGTIYLGTLGKWSSTDENGAAATDNEDVTLYANEKTDIIINTNDTGDVNTLYNPTGIGKGVRLVRAFAFPGKINLTAENYGAAEEVAITIYEDDTENLTNTANFTVKLGDILVADLDENGKVQYETDENGNTVIKSKPLEDGEVYIIYYYVSDKANNALNTKVRTAKFIYDTTAPVITVDGDNGNEEKTEFCESATITVYEEDATLKVNGAVAELTQTTVDGDTVYTYTVNNTTAGNYIATVTDKAGNSTSKKFKVEGHNYVTKKADATCTVDGYEKTECLTCGNSKNAPITIPAIKHNYVAFEEKEPTCTEHGWKTEKCANCGNVVKTEYEVDGDGEFVLDSNNEKTPLFPATGHEHKKDGEGNIIYTTVIAPTCSTKGKGVAYCTVCGEGELTTDLKIVADAHKLGTLKTLQPTCTKDGMTYRVCKLCGLNVKVETLEATGHGTVAAGTAKWVVTTEPTCKYKGEETLQCTICTQYIDSDDEDEEIDTREIAKTENHKYVEDSTVTENGIDYKVYKCSVCGDVKKVELEKAVTYTVTFIGEDGKTTISTLTMTSGVDTELASTDTPEAPAKTDASGVYKYTFAGWAEATEKDGTYTAGDAVKLPLEVTEDVTLMPVYTKTKIIYTHKFMTYGDYDVENKGFTMPAVFETMMGVVGGTAVPSTKPTMKETELYTFEFLGWTAANGGNIVNDFTVSGTAKDRTFYAKFKAIPKKYNVTYLSGTNYVWNTTVNGGESVTFGGTTPTKAYDETYHYTFSKWYLDATLKTEYTNQAIVDNTQLYAGFDAIEHDYDYDNGEVVQDATCVLPEITEYACSCGHKIQKTGDALGHIELPAVIENGYSVVYCSVCKEVVKQTPATVKVTFDYNNNATPSVIRTFNIGEVITYTGTQPAKASDAKNTYTFAGWYVSGDANEVIVDFTSGEIKASGDVTYVAKYTATERVYNVTYVDINHSVLKNHSLKYGDKVPAYEGTDPTKDYDAKNHYVFAGWSVEAGATVTGDLMITPVFTTVAHTYTTSTSNPTCDQAGGITKSCTCGYSYTDPTTSVPAKGHDWDVTTVPATYESDGLETKTCKTCGKTETKVLPKLEYRTVTVTVKDSKGNVVEGAKVELYKDGVWVATDFSDLNGKVMFTVKESGKYTVVVSGIEDASEITYDINVGNEGYDDKGNPSKTVSITNCTCSCHRDGFWGTIFRMFHKLIKLFTGKINCCSCPDSRY